MFGRYMKSNFGDARQMAPEPGMLPFGRTLYLHYEKNAYCKQPVNLGKKQTSGMDIGNLSVGQFGGHH